jgi:peptide/nickel transport system permease protein
MKRFLEHLFYFAGLLVVQLALIAGVEYVLFLVAPGVKQKLLLSMGAPEKSSYAYWDYLVTFKNWFTRIFTRGDLGRLMSTGDPIRNFVFDTILITVKLVVVALLICLLLSIIIIYLKKSFPNSRLVKGFVFGMQFLSSIHYIVLGYLVIVELKMSQFPIFSYLILAVGNGMLNDMVELIENELDGILNSPYYRAALARGGKLWRNILPPLGITLARIFNSKLPMLLGGSFIVEYVMNLHGIGVFTIQYGVRGTDYNLLLIYSLFVTLVIVLSNLMANSLQKYLDPRPEKVF